MTLNLSPITILVFVLGLGVLTVYSIYDIKSRKVPNEVILFCAIFGLFIAILTGYAPTNWILHLSATLSFIILGYLLFRLGSIGGADAKAGISIGIVSPGLSLGAWSSPVFEGFLIASLEICVMLLVGYGYSMIRRDDDEITPLIPGLLVGYLIVQLLALV